MIIAERLFWTSMVFGFLALVSLCRDAMAHDWSPEDCTGAANIVALVAEHRHDTIGQEGQIEGSERPVTVKDMQRIIGKGLMVCHLQARANCLAQDQADYARFMNIVERAFKADDDVPPEQLAADFYKTCTP